VRFAVRLFLFSLAGSFIGRGFFEQQEDDVAVDLSAGVGTWFVEQYGTPARAIGALVAVALAAGVLRTEKLREKWDATLAKFFLRPRGLD
jgi:hypothetical protein